MKHNELLDDAIGASPGWSSRAKYQALSDLLGEAGTPATPKAVEQWFTRANIPTKWLYAIKNAATQKGRDIILDKYA